MAGVPTGGRGEGSPPLRCGIKWLWTSCLPDTRLKTGDVHAVLLCPCGTDCDDGGCWRAWGALGGTK